MEAVVDEFFRCISGTAGPRSARSRSAAGTVTSTSGSATSTSGPTGSGSGALLDSTYQRLAVSFGAASADALFRRRASGSATVTS